jgi:hypothetical protein
VRNAPALPAQEVGDSPQQFGALERLDQHARSAQRQGRDEVDAAELARYRDVQVRDQTVGYYQTTGLSLGLQAGAESRALVFMFMTQEALDRFLTSKGWTAGVDASVAVLKAGANGTLDTRSATAAVNAFALTNSGLMAAANVEGTRVSKLDLPVPLR